MYWFISISYIVIFIIMDSERLINKSLRRSILLISKNRRTFFKFTAALWFSQLITGHTFFGRDLAKIRLKPNFVISHCTDMNIFRMGATKTISSSWNLMTFVFLSNSLNAIQVFFLLVPYIHWHTTNKPTILASCQLFFGGGDGLVKFHFQPRFDDSSFSDGGGLRVKYW